MKVPEYLKKRDAEPCVETIDKVFNHKYKPIPFYIWFLLLFKKTIISTDVEIVNSNEYKSVVYAKRLFGITYILKCKQFINGEPA